MSDNKNKWAECLAGRPRWFRDVDLSGFFNHDGTAVPLVRVHVLFKQEEIDALKAAAVEAARQAQGAEEGAADLKADPEFTVDMKTVQALWRAFRDPADPRSDAFVSPQWMKENLTGQQIATLLNVYTQRKFEAAGIDLKFDRERVESYRDGCVALYDTTLPDQLLAPLSREHFTVLALSAMKFWRDDVDALTERVAELEAKLAGVGGEAPPVEPLSAESVG